MSDWASVIGDLKTTAYFKQILTEVKRQYLRHTVYPPAGEIFTAFKLTLFERLKVVIIGQDPYHGPGQAHGLAFSVRQTVTVPPSLLNIYKELAADIPGFVIPNHGYLVRWAEQGVFLLNNSLTVAAGQPQSHRFIGWQQFTDAVITRISARKEHAVFMLWGAAAIAKKSLINTDKHLVLTAPHPSPLSAHRGFLGCRHFSQANAYLVKNNLAPINWQL